MNDNFEIISKNQSWPNRGIILAFVWKDRTKPQKIIPDIQCLAVGIKPLMLGRSAHCLITILTELRLPVIECYLQ
jgi:hypothetical protein